MGRQLKYWCITWNNPDVSGAELLDKITQSAYFSYVMFQKEKGESGTEHFQIYLELKKAQRISGVHKILGTTHVACFGRNGTGQQASDYCCKEESRIEGPWTAGDLFIGNPGKRSDLSDLRDSVLQRTKSRKEIVDSCSNNQQLRFVENLYKYVRLNPEYQPKKVVWCYGKTGEGKTRHVMSKVDGVDYYMADTAQWMDGYYGQEVVIIDELRPKDWPYARMLKLLDGYEILTAIKGGYVIWNPKKIYITTPFKPEDTYFRTAHSEGGIEQLIRRISKVKLFGPENSREFYEQIDINGKPTYRAIQ